MASNPLVSIGIFLQFFLLYFPAYSQSITTVTPDQGYQGQNLQVDITGNNLNFSQASSIIIWLKQGNDSIPSSVADPTSANTAYSFFNFPLSASTGLYDLYCFNIPLSQTTVMQNGFEILAAQSAPGVPVLITPGASATVTNTTPSFDWSDASNAFRYELMVDDDISFASPIFHPLNIQASNYTNANISLDNGVYFWKVRAKNLSEIWGNWSVVNSFTIDAIPGLTLINPDNGYVGQTNLHVNITGVNTHFDQASYTIDFRLHQQNYTINCSPGSTNNPFYGLATLNIPAGAPTGYYDLSHYFNGDTITMLNAFYIHESNRFSGTMFIDANNNQVFDMGEVAYPQGIISNSFNSSSVLTQSDGSYEGYVPAGTFNLTLVNPPMYYAVSPLQHTVNFSGTGGSDSGNDFAISPISGVHDLRITATSSAGAHIGFSENITLTVKNLGPVVESGALSLSFSPLLSVLSSTNPNYTITGNEVTWNYTGLQPLATEQIIVELDVPSSVQVNTILDFTAEVTGTAQDTTPDDNIYYFYQDAVSSFDPNIKEVIPSDGLTPQQVQAGNYLEYSIHFQNTGTADAVNIRILDTLNPYLDITTFEVLAASHNWEARLLENRLVEFRFNNIHLPDSNTNELLSHGFIKYRIKPVSSFSPGDQIENTAYIYFDFNDPVVTNTTNTTIITGTEEHEISNFNLLASPNPFNTQTIISYTIAQPGITDLKLYNYQGQLIKVISCGFIQTGNYKIILNMAEQADGVYFISLNSGNVSEFKKIILVK